MIFDLAATFAEGGAHDALRPLLVEWFGVQDLPPTATTVELLDEIRRVKILSQIPQPQDRLLSDSEIDRVNDEVVIAEENEVLWFATLDRHDVQPSVSFFDEPPEGRGLGREHHQLGSLDLSRFLLGVLVANAVYSAGASHFRAAIAPETEVAGMVVPAVESTLGNLGFPAVVGGPGWFGMQWKTKLEIVKVDRELRVSTVLSQAAWERFTEIAPSQASGMPHVQRNPWQLDPTLPHWQWIPATGEA